VRSQSAAVSHHTSLSSSTSPHYYDQVVWLAMTKLDKWQNLKQNWNIKWFEMTYWIFRRNTLLIHNNPTLPVAVCYRNQQRTIEETKWQTTSSLSFLMNFWGCPFPSLALDALHTFFWFVLGSKLRTSLMSAMRSSPQVKVSPRPSRVLRNTLKMQVLVLDILYSAGTILQDMAV